MSVNIDGTNGEFIESVLTECGTPVFIKACAAGNIDVKLQAYAFSTNTVTVVQSQMIAFAFAGT